VDGPSKPSQGAPNAQNSPEADNFHSPGVGDDENIMRPGGAVTRVSRGTRRQEPSPGLDDGSRSEPADAFRTATGDHDGYRDVRGCGLHLEEKPMDRLSSIVLWPNRDRHRFDDAAQARGSVLTDRWGVILANWRPGGSDDPEDEKQRAPQDGPLPPTSPTCEDDEERGPERQRARRRRQRRNQAAESKSRCEGEPRLAARKEVSCGGLPPPAVVNTVLNTAVTVRADGWIHGASAERTGRKGRPSRLAAPSRRGKSSRLLQCEPRLEIMKAAVSKTQEGSVQHEKKQQ